MSTASDALIARMSPAPDAARETLIHTFVEALETAGVWSKLDTLYVKAAHDQQGANLNWINSSFTLLPVNSPTFAVDEGYTGDGSSAYLDTQWEQADSGPNFTQNGASMAVWIRTAGTVDASVVGIAGTAVRFQLNPRVLSGGDTGKMRGRSNNTSDAVSTATVPDRTGFFVHVRADANTVRFYRNGVQVGTDIANTATATSGANLHLLRNNSGTFVNDQMSIHAAGGPLTSQEVADFYAAANDYMTGLTAPSGITGTASITEAADTVSSAGTLALAAALSQTEANDSLSAAATLGIAGAAAIQEADDSLSSVADLSLSAAGSITEEGDTSSAAGELTIAAAVSASEDDDALASAAMLPLAAQIAATDADDTLAAEGVLAAEGTGSVSILEADDSLAASATLSLVASAAITEADDTVSSIGDNAAPARRGGGDGAEYTRRRPKRRRVTHDEIRRILGVREEAEPPAPTPRKQREAVKRIVAEVLPSGGLLGPQNPELRQFVAQRVEQAWQPDMAWPDLRRALVAVLAQAEERARQIEQEIEEEDEMLLLWAA